MLEQPATQPAPGLLRRAADRVAPLASAVRSPRGKSVFWALVDQLVVGATNFLTLMLLGRQAGADSLGVFYLAMTVFYMILTVQESLISTPYTVYAAGRTGSGQRHYSGAALSQCLGLCVCCAVLLAAVGAGVYGFHGDPVVGAATLAGAFAVPMWLLKEFSRRYLFAKMQITSVLKLSVASALCQLGLLGALAYTGRLSAVTAILASGVGGALTAGLMLWTERRAIRFSRWRWNYFARRNLRVGRWLLASQGTAVLASHTMPWLLVAWLGPAATGVFAACDAILRLANPIIVGLTNVLTPWVAIGHQNGGEAELRRIVLRVSLMLSAFLLAFCGVLAVAGDRLLELTFGAEYAAYGTTLAVLGLNQLVLKVALAPGRGLLVLEKANLILRADAAGLVASLAAGWVLIPAYGILGAAFSLVVGSLAVTAVTVVSYLAVMKSLEPQAAEAEGCVAIGGAVE